MANVSTADHTNISPKPKCPFITGRQLRYLSPPLQQHEVQIWLAARPSCTRSLLIDLTRKRYTLQVTISIDVVDLRRA